MMHRFSCLVEVHFNVREAADAHIEASSNVICADGYDENAALQAAMEASMADKALHDTTPSHGQLQGDLDEERQLRKVLAISKMEGTPPAPQ
jgi:hypothetical protein